MLVPYKKQYIKFSRVEDAEKVLVFATLFENNGQEEVTLSEPKLIRVIFKSSAAKTLLLAVGSRRFAHSVQPIVSPFVQRFFASYSIPHFSYARPPTQ